MKNNIKAMAIFKLKTLGNYIDVWRGDKKIISVIFFLSILFLGTYIRIRLFAGINGDYTVYISNWYDHLKNFGFAGFKDNFANYNFPYLFMLYLATLIPIPKLIAVKLISVFFDYVLVYAVYKVVLAVSKSRLRSALASIVVFILPTVFINSAYWGQTDAIYSSFLMLSLAAILNGKFKTAWLMFGVAFAFKLQAIFFLPVLLYIWAKRKGEWWSPSIAPLTFIVLSSPPILAGRSVISNFSVYLNQYGYQQELSANIPNFYYWLPQYWYEIINRTGVIFAVCIIGVILYTAITRLKYKNASVVFFSMLMLGIIPYILPQMHDRYFFVFEIMCVAALFCIGNRYIFLVVASQFVTITVYMKTLFGQNEVPFGYLAAIMTIITTTLMFVYIQNYLVVGQALRKLKLKSSDNTKAITNEA